MFDANSRSLSPAILFARINTYMKYNEFKKIKNPFPLLESKTAPLYHFTSWSRLLDILISDEIKPGRNNYVSLTRSPTHFFSTSFSACLIVDQHAITRTNKITQHFGDVNTSNLHDRESEERVKNINPLHKYLNNIVIDYYYLLDMDEKSMQNELKILNDYTTNHNVEIYVAKIKEDKSWPRHLRTFDEFMQNREAEWLAMWN